MAELGARLVEGLTRHQRIAHPLEIGNGLLVGVCVCLGAAFGEPLRVALSKTFGIALGMALSVTLCVALGISLSVALLIAFFAHFV